MQADQTLLQFIHECTWRQAPPEVQHQTRRLLLDLVGVAASGTQTRLSHLIRQHAWEQFNTQGNGARLLFDGRRTGLAGAALAGGMTIDSVDAHDGHKLCKGHVGCGVLPGWLAFLEAGNIAAGTNTTHNKESPVSMEAFLGGLLMAYEVGTRAGLSLHDTACDYHTSGAWIALAVAATGARALQLDSRKTREALGIAEYHGPRSQMMRCIDYPTMVKDGSGWGAMCGVSAALLARDGFTGAPALTTITPEVAHFWDDLGSRWRIQEQYYKPYPVCRWAQSAVTAALALREHPAFIADQVVRVEIGTFHESLRLAATCPDTTEQAQYSTPFPVAAALLHGQLGVAEIEGAGLQDTRVVALSQTIHMHEVPAYNQAFPARRISDVTLILQDGQRLESGPVEATGDPENPVADLDIIKKYQQFTQPVLGTERSQRLQALLLEHAVSEVDWDELSQLIYSNGVQESHE